MKISAIIPAYNAENTIVRALQSVLAQTRPADEIIVIDDGSTDKTADAVRSFGNRVKLICQENAGVSVARNTGIQAASGDWIAFLDADDEWLPKKLQLQTEHIQRHPDLKWTYSNFTMLDASGKSALAHSSAAIKKGLCESEVFHDYFEAYVNHAYSWTSTLLVHRTVFNAAGFFEPGMKRAQDNDLWYRIAYHFPQVGYISEPLAVYHLDTPHSSTKINDSIEFMVRLIDRHEVLSRQYGRYDAFCLCITHMLQTWIRQLLQRKRYADAKCLLARFPQHLSSRFRREMRFRLACPCLTNSIADALMLFKKKNVSFENGVPKS